MKLNPGDIYEALSFFRKACVEFGQDPCPENHTRMLEEQTILLALILQEDVTTEQL